MDSIENLLVDSSRTLVDIVVQKVGDNQNLLDNAMELLFSDKYPISMRAGRVAQFVCEKFPYMGEKHLERIIYFLPKAKVDGAKRSALKILIDAPLIVSEQCLSKLIDVVFYFTENESEAISVRAYAIDILIKVIAIYPELKTELKAVLEKIYPNSSKGLKSRCKKILKQLENY